VVTRFCLSHHFPSSWSIHPSSQRKMTAPETTTKPLPSPLSTRLGYFPDSKICSAPVLGCWGFQKCQLHRDDVDRCNMSWLWRGGERWSQCIIGPQFSCVIGREPTPPKFRVWLPRRYLAYVPAGSYREQGTLGYLFLFFFPAVIAHMGARLGEKLEWLLSLIPAFPLDPADSDPSAASTAPAHSQKQSAALPVLAPTCRALTSLSQSAVTSRWQSGGFFVFFFLLSLMVDFPATQ